MIREDVIRMAREAHIYLDNFMGSAIVGAVQLERFAAQVAALAAKVEREECAKVCDAESAKYDDRSAADREAAAWAVAADDCAEKIRERGKP